VGALAQTDRGAPGGLGQTEPARPTRSPACRARTGDRGRQSWNVLTRELVPFPPAAGLAESRPARRPARRAEPGGTGRPVARRPARPDPDACSGTRPHDGTNPARAAHTAGPAQSAAAAVDRATPGRTRRVAARSRGLRRLLPGAATLAVLASVWVGAGALSSLHRPALTVPAAAVKVPGGYLYVARPGDTLWSIASELQPGGDPRPLVAQLEQQLHGAELAAGDRLILP